MPESPVIKICFAGAGAFAVPVLAALLEEKGIVISRIITQMDKPAGRKKLLTPTPVGLFCEEKNIPCEKVPNINEPSFLASLAAEKMDFLLVVSFGQILKKDLLALPGKGCLNIHASILPEYRGASPIISVLRAGEKKTGVTLMQMDAGLDTGDILEIYPYDIPEGIRADALEEALAQLAGSRIGEGLQKHFRGELTPLPQDHTKATLTRKIRKKDGSIFWEKMDAEEIEHMISAYTPWPSAVFTLEQNGKLIQVKLTSGKALEETGKPDELPGQIVSPEKHAFTVQCGNGTLLRVEKVIPEGKKEMDAGDFARGYLKGATLLGNGPIP